MGSAGGACLAALAVLLLVITTASAAKYTVGDSSGWTTGADYTTWASDKKIKVGDSLVFNYAGGAHNVAEVSAADYASCSAANALSSDGSGTTTVALKTAGKHYFICGVTGHCSSGMKLAVDVAAATAASPPKASPTTPDAPDTPSTTPTSPSTPGATPKTPATVLAPPAKQSESGASELRATAVAGLGAIAGLVAAGLF
ncbi:blue copper protein-like [Hordeum vulgare subsp. vulgare]|uniref:Phytocyanin domain-containing protein n=1 Tax=Hordeum vulgare subsp. vulgare TaxID=112509 RepID=A0A8I6YKT5_HORVV|nr:blue copper protein-like [Hordeum vulgare subsp. vulgare]